MRVRARFVQKCTLIWIDPVKVPWRFSKLPPSMCSNQRRAPGQAVIGVDALGDHSELDQDRALRREVLSIGGAAGVSDADSFHRATVRQRHLHGEKYRTIFLIQQPPAFSQGERIMTDRPQRDARLKRWTSTRHWISSASTGCS